MIKKALLAIMIALPMCLSAQSIKLGVVNASTVFDAMPERAAAQTTLEQASKTYEDEYKKLTDEFDKKYAEFQNLEESTPESIKERRIQEIQDMQNRIQQFRNQASQDLERQQQTLMAPIQQKIEDAIKAVGSENNFTMIFQDMIPSYVGSDVIDVTPQVRAKLGLK
jgi:outer membrane protein